MLLPTLLLLLGIGGTTWVLAQFFSYNNLGIGLGVLGGTLVLIAGAAVVLTGLEIKTGSVTTYTYRDVGGASHVDQEIVDFQYQTANIGAAFGVPILGSLGIGGLLMILGTLLISQSLSDSL